MLISFPWSERWLNGSEYEYLIKNHELYISHLDIEIFTDHPADIYSCPSHGLVYFLKNQSLKELGFPRIKGLKKRFKWKKMNFLTPLPKQNPKVTYLVATGKLGQSCYRMHIVHYNSFLPILCHMLKIQSSCKAGLGIPSRQHFKEGQEVSKTEESEFILQENTESTKEFLNPTRHPLVIEALLYKTAPFRKPFEEITRPC